MRVPRQYNFKTLPTEPNIVPSWFDEFLRRLNVELTRISSSLTGPRSIDLGNSGAAVTVKLYLADLTKLTLNSATPAITLDITTRAGDHATLEIAQDGTGGRVPSWVNATGTGGAVTAPAAGASKKTLYDATFDGTSWVLAVLASNF